MASADSVIIFSEGTFQEQIQELVNYLARGLSTDDRIAYIKPYQDLLLTPAGGKPITEDEPRRQQTVALVVSDVKGLGEGNEREQEGFFNLLFAHVLALFPAGGQLLEQVDALLVQIAGAPVQAAGAGVKYRILSNLFNAAPRTSAVRLHAYKTLLQVASEQGEVGSLQVGKSDVEGWLEEWEVSVEEKAGLLEKVAEALEKNGQPEEAYPFLLRRLSLLPASSPLAPAASLSTITFALSHPFVHSFDPLIASPALQSISSHPLSSLLQIFFRGTPADLASWLSQPAHTAALAEANLSQPKLEEKLRLLSLASLASSYLSPTSPSQSSEIPYPLISRALSIPDASVEPLVLSAIRAGLVSGKLSQTSQTFRVQRAAVRAFEKPEWERLEERAAAWREGLLGVLGVLKSRRAGQTEKGEKQVEVVQTEAAAVEAAA